MNYKVKIWLLFAYTALVILGAFFLAPIPQQSSYHLFADTRQIFGIPNFLNVISNLPFAPVGIFGAMVVYKSSVHRAISSMYYSLFLGIILIGFGSAFYHLQPDNQRLAWDRIPMTIVFMAFLSATIAECIDLNVGKVLLFPLIVIGVSSVIWWNYTESLGAGDLRYYAAVQFYPVGFILLTLVLFPSGGNKQILRLLAWVVVWYGFAKIFEYFDKEVFYHTGFISGHSLKHLAAALSTAVMTKIFLTKYPKSLSTR